MTETKKEFGVRAGTPFRTQQSEHMPNPGPGGGKSTPPSGNTPKPE